MKTILWKSKPLLWSLALLVMTNTYPIYAQDFWQPTPGPYGGSVQTFAANSKGKIFVAGTIGHVYVSDNYGQSWEGFTSLMAPSFTRAMVINANDVIFAGTGAIYRSVDDGLNWQYLSMGEYLSITCMILNASGHIFVGSLFNGIYRSTNNGDTWEAINNNLPVGSPNYVQSMAYNKNTGDLYAAVDNQGIYKSTNNGESWSRSSLNLSQYYFNDLLINNQGVIFVTTSQGIYKSVDNGNTWTQANQGIETSGITQLAQSGSGELFAGGSSGHIYRSTDQGATWTRIDNNSLPDYVTELFTYGSSYIFAGTEREGIFISSDNGQSWQQKNEGFRSTTVNDLVINPDGRIFSAHNGLGMYRSDDFGASWQPFNVGLANFFLQDLEIADNGDLLAATSSGVYALTYNGTSWTSRNSGLPYAPASALTIDRNNNVLYTGLSNKNGVYKSYNLGINWFAANEGLNFENSTVIRKLLWLSDDTPYGKLFLATTDWQNSKGIFRSLDGGTSWEAINNGLTNFDVFSIAADKAGNIYATTNGGGFYRSKNSGDEWEQLATGWYETIAFNSAGHIFISGYDGYNQGVFRSVDGGHSWEKYNSGIALFNIKCLLVDDNDYIYAGLYSYSIFKGRVSTTLPIPAAASPLNDALAQPIDLLLQWQPVSAATRYQIQVSAMVDFSPLILDENVAGETQTEIGGLQHNTRYFWRIQAGNEYAVSAWSEPNTFTTFREGPVLLTPVNHEGGLDLTVGVAWQAVSEASSYHLQVATDPGFTNITREMNTLANNSINLLNLAYTTKYYWRVRANLPEGATDWSEIRDFSTKLAPPDLNNPANLAENVSPSVALMWMQMPAATEFRVQLSKNDAFSTPEVDQGGITANQFTPGNLNYNTLYFWRVVGKFEGHWGEWSAIWQFTTSAYPSTFQADKSFSFPSYNSPSDFKSSDYRIIGLPGNGGQPVDGVLGEGFGERWTAYWDNGRTTDYMIPFSPGNNQFRFTAGKAFWIIYRGSWRFTGEVQTASLNTDNQAAIPLHNGWNLITNPFPNVVDWNAVRQANDLGNQPLWRFDGSFKQTQEFRPYEGYYFDNTANRQQLYIPYSTALPKAPVILEPDWQIAITVNGSDYTDGPIFLGVSPRAESGVDALDHRKPRAPGDLPMIFFERGDWGDAFTTMASDIRPPLQELDTWPFFVRTLTAEEFQLRFSDWEEVPDDLQIRLIDYQTMKAYDLRENPNHRVERRPAGLNRFAVMVGSEAALSDKWQELLPNHFELGKNFPNPFNPATSIPLSLPERAEIRLTIYDLLGARIKTLYEGSLEAGQYLFGWDGTNATGERCPSGVYLYQLKTGTGIETTRKMLLIK